jgi:hypothetical protein
MAMAPQPTGERMGPRGSRLVYLDNLKVALVAGVIIGHAAMTYGAAGTWVFEAGDVGDATLGSASELALSVLIGVGVMFAMGLFMLISGLFTPRALERAGPRSFALGRLARLGAPIVLYVAVVMPLLGVLIAYAVDDRHGPIWPYYRERLEALATGPLWFIVILLAISLGYVAWRQVVTAHASAAWDGFTGHTLAVAALIIGVASFAVRIVFPIDSGQYLDAHVWLWPQCAVLFGLGAVTAEHGRDEPTSARVRRQWAVGSAVAFVVMMLVLSTLGSADDQVVLGGLHWEALVVALFEGVFAIGMSLTVLAFFRRHADRERRRTRPMARSAYGAFVLQAPVLVGIALAMHPLALEPEVKFLVLAAGGVIGSFAAAWLVIALWTRASRVGASRRTRRA